MSTGPSNSDLSRDFGHMEGKLAAVKESLDRIERSVSEGFKEMEQRLTALEAKENQRKGAITLLMVLSGAVGAVVVKLAAMMFGNGGG